MKNVRLISIILTAVSILSVVETTHARSKQNFVDCNQNQRDNINAGWQYIRNNLDVLRNDYEWEGRLPRDRERVNRRMGREIGNTTVVCRRCGSGTGKTPGGVFASRIHICVSKMDRESIYSGGTRNGFCKLTSVLAHEYAHSIGMQRRVGHDLSDDIDEVRMFGRFVSDMCLQDGLERDLTPFTTRTPAPVSPTVGINLFSQKDFANRVRNFGPADPHNDLRGIGRNNSISSIDVLSGTWEVCDKRDFRGWCLELSGGQRLNRSQLKSFNMNNKISSLRPIVSPRTNGITIYAKRDMRGRSAHFEISIRDLSQMKLNNKARSIRLDGGTWSICRDKDYGRCTVVSGNVNDLRTIGYNQNISSIKQDI